MLDLTGAGLVGSGRCSIDARGFAFIVPRYVGPCGAHPNSILSSTLALSDFSPFPADFESYLVTNVSYLCHL